MLLTTLALFGVVIIILFLGTPIAMGLGFMGLAGIFFFLEPAQMSQITNVAFSQATSSTTLMIPLFILMAEFLANSNIAAGLFDVISRRLRRIKGNMAIGSIIASAIFSAVCGSSPATAVTIGTISIPSMIRNGYKRSFSAGIQAAGGTLGILIPPSLTFVVYGIITETSIVDLFMAGFVPGIMMAIILIICVSVIVRIKPQLISTETYKKAQEEAAKQKHTVGGDIFAVAPLVILIIIVLGVLYLGIVTPTEASAIGAIGAAVVVLIQKKMTKDCFSKSMYNTTKNSCMILFLMFGGLIFSYFITAMGLPQALAGFVIEFSPNKWVTLIMVNIILLILGCFLEPLGMLLITLPFIYPTLVAQGFDPIWLGVVITLNCEIGMITPPVGLNLFVLKGALKTLKMKEIIAGSWPYVIVLLVGIFILTLFPQIALWLPSTMG